MRWAGSFEATCVIAPTPGLGISKWQLANELAKAEAAIQNCDAEWVVWGTGEALRATAHIAADDAFAALDAMRGALPQALDACHIAPDTEVVELSVRWPRDPFARSR